jgi:SAM-dependent methyltransferase
VHPELYREMFRLETDHWWFRARRRVFRHLLRERLGGGPARPVVCDLGSGCGKQVEALSDEFDMVGVEPSREARDLAARRGVDLRAGHLPDDLPFAAGSFDAVLLTDVLEHVAEDHASLRAAGRLLRPGGVALVTVPALPWLWTARDEVHQHHRRYSGGEFRDLVEGSGLRIDLVSAFNVLLAPIAIPVRVLGALRAAASEAASEPGGDLWIPPWPVNRLLEEVFAAERWLLGGPLPPLGLSLLAVLRRDEVRA